jgi:hypothetical protein
MKKSIDVNIKNWKETQKGKITKKNKDNIKRSKSNTKIVVMVGWCVRRV